MEPGAEGCIQSIACSTRYQDSGNAMQKRPPQPRDHRQASLTLMLNGN